MVGRPVKCPKCFFETIVEDDTTLFCQQCGARLQAEDFRTELKSRKALQSKMAAAAASGGYTGTCAFADELLADDPSDPDPIYFKGLAAMRANNNLKAYEEWTKFASKADGAGILDRYDSMLDETVESMVRRTGDFAWCEQIQEPMLALSKIIDSKCIGMHFYRDFIRIMIKRFPLEFEAAKDLFYASEVVKFAVVLFAHMYLTDINSLAAECRSYTAFVFQAYKKRRGLPKEETNGIGLVNGYSRFLDHICVVSDRMARKMTAEQRAACRDEFLLADDAVKVENARNAYEAFSYLLSLRAAGTRWKKYEKLYQECLEKFLAGIQAIAER